MLYLFYGADFRKTQKGADAFLEAIRKKKPNVSFVEMRGEEFSEERFGELTWSRGLFEGRIAVVLRGVLGEKGAAEYFKKSAKRLAASPNVFVFVEGPLAKGAASAIAKHAEKVWEHGGRSAAVQKAPPAVFRFTDAVGARDRKRAWVAFEEALRSGAPPENIHGALFWQMKILYLACRGDGNGSAALARLKLNPFVLRKARQFSKNYSPEEVRAHLGKLIGMYHDSRRAGPDLEIALERWLLAL